MSRLFKCLPQLRKIILSNCKSVRDTTIGKEKEGGREEGAKSREETEEEREREEEKGEREL